MATFLLFVVIATASPVVLAPGYGTDEPDAVDLAAADADAA